MQWSLFFAVRSWVDKCPALAAVDIERRYYGRAPLRGKMRLFEKHIHLTLQLTCPNHDSSPCSQGSGKHSDKAPTTIVLGASSFLDGSELKLSLRDTASKNLEQAQSAQNNYRESPHRSRIRKRLGRLLPKFSRLPSLTISLWYTTQQSQELQIPTYPVELEEPRTTCAWELQGQTSDSSSSIDHMSNSSSAQHFNMQPRHLNSGEFQGPFPAPYHDYQQSMISTVNHIPTTNSYVPDQYVISPITYDGRCITTDDSTTSAVSPRSDVGYINSSLNPFPPYDASLRPSGGTLEYRPGFSPVTSSSESRQSPFAMDYRSGCAELPGSFAYSIETSPSPTQGAYGSYAIPALHSPLAPTRRIPTTGIAVLPTSSTVSGDATEQLDISEAQAISARRPTTCTRSNSSSQESRIAYQPSMHSVRECVREDHGEDLPTCEVASSSNSSRDIGCFPAVKATAWHLSQAMNYAMSGTSAAKGKCAKGDHQIYDDRMEASANDSQQHPTPSTLFCDQCSMPFTGKYRNGNRLRHIRSKHSTSATIASFATKLVCRVCKLRYKRTDARKKHEWEKHGIPDAKPKPKRRK
ncbi:hypothetical protein CC78DRAFT_577558 [Lojkania enalia]|uniref:Uncharacterized protein n=1 Tax=Lojkania enalia TaxID=147567 RepID=A0A9P4KI82_9PLEO|nr:hypothetical protein CC78DRAFT_577558 [Didymosphaeria enalia]